MDRRTFEEGPDCMDQPADNFAEDMPKEQFPETTDENNPDEKSDTDNVADEEGGEEFFKLKDSYLRLMAEYDNYRKRTLKEKSELIRNGGEKVLTGLLPVMDDFQRALENIEGARDVAAVREGVELIYSKFIAFLKQNGVVQIEVKGEEFNEDLAEAVALVPAQDESQKGKVIDSVQTGYTLNGKVIRHAKVVVAN